ncbi:MAG TPA: hypothetical protein VGM14_18050 [Streptosporangiaceae bacterium]|jgi:hypothetical protein
MWQRGLDCSQAAAFDEAYVPLNGEAYQLATDKMLTSAPPPFWRRIGANARHMAIVPK